MRIDPVLDAPELTPKLSADFAAKVLRAAEGVRRRRRVGVAMGLVGLVCVGLWSLGRAPERRSDPRNELVAADFAWLEEVGAAPSSPDSLLFPDLADRSSASAERSSADPEDPVLGFAESL